MKTNLFKLKMVVLITLFYYLTPCNSDYATAQVSHNVSVDNFVFTPSALSINVGDTVKWTNNSGVHNVDGTTAVFPSNPVSFGNSVGSNWTYTFVFNTAGEYDYHCDVHYTMGMTGHISVSNNAGISENISDNNSLLLVYPNPAIKSLNIEISDKVFLIDHELSFNIYTSEGKEIANVINIKTNKLILYTDGLNKGIYFYILKNNNEVVEKGKIIIE